MPRAFLPLTSFVTRVFSLNTHYAVLAHAPRVFFFTVDCPYARVRPTCLLLFFTVVLPLDLILYTRVFLLHVHAQTSFIVDFLLARGIVVLNTCLVRTLPLYLFLRARLLYVRSCPDKLFRWYMSRVVSTLHLPS